MLFLEDFPIELGDKLNWKVSVNKQTKNAKSTNYKALSLGKGSGKHLLVPAGHHEYCLLTSVNTVQTKHMVKESRNRIPGSDRTPFPDVHHFRTSSIYPLYINRRIGKPYARISRY